MKIDMNSIRPVNQYKIASQNVAAIKTDSVQNTDKVEISSEGKLFSDALLAAKKDIQKRMERPVAGLGEIAEKIEHEEYGVDTTSLANDILLDK